MKIYIYVYVHSDICENIEYWKFKFNQVNISKIQIFLPIKNTISVAFMHRFYEDSGDFFKAF